MDIEQEYDLILYAFNRANYILDAPSFEKHLSVCASILAGLRPYLRRPPGA